MVNPYGMTRIYQNFGNFIHSEVVYCGVADENVFFRLVGHIVCPLCGIISVLPQLYRRDGDGAIFTLDPLAMPILRVNCGVVRYFFQCYTYASYLT